MKGNRLPNHLRFTIFTTSYVWQIVKILLCLMIIPVLIYRNHIFQIENSGIRLFVGVLCVCAGIASIFCIYVSIAEILLISEKRSKATKSTNLSKATTVYTVDKLLSIVESNDIVEIQILTGGQLIEVGASAESYPGDSTFYNKRYYIGKNDYSDIDEFTVAIQPYATDGELSIVSIDGLSP